MDAGLSYLQASGCDFDVLSVQEVSFETPLDVGQHEFIETQSMATRSWLLTLRVASEQLPLHLMMPVFLMLARSMLVMHMFQLWFSSEMDPPL